MAPCLGRGAPSEAEKEEIRRTLEARPEAAGVLFEDHGQAYERFRAQFLDDAGLLQVVQPSDIPESFHVLMRPDAAPEDFTAVARTASEVPGVSHAVDQNCFRDRMSVLSVIENHLPGEDDEPQCSFPE
ncbi:hypothetical protein Psi01_36590 [Planobispora siamensis]|uniref:FtsX extracellular domain-containing protein n=2 Tax=Planobispora siamensis TaxID=936338 RepID=A0A8J3SGR2_9ACTN|nr:hypothetical protein Psi01_36590 [Planobispora siamensis]